MRRGGDISSGIDKTEEISSTVKSKLGVESLAHLTCIGASRESVRKIARELRDMGIENIMALRGDIPKGESTRPSADFTYASDLIRELKEFGGFCVGAACYPEGHIDCDDSFKDLVYLREKQDSGAEFFITQLFFDNGLFERFLERARRMGITAPISAGVMPIFSRGQIERMIFMCGVSLPSAIVRLLHKYENDPKSLKQAGIEYAADQMEGLIRGGADGVHIYTMNQPAAAIAAMERCRNLGLRRG